MALLRAIETGEVRPIGGGAARSVDVRYIAATDMNLEVAITENNFRLALYHRLSGYEIEVPSLRRRRDDIGRLLIHFLRQELAATGQDARLAPPPAGGSPWVAPSVVARLARFDWPGNVRQLRNVARRLVLANRDQDKMRMPASPAQQSSHSQSTGLLDHPLWHSGAAQQLSLLHGEESAGVKVFG